jgi:hypothetical protein
VKVSSIDARFGRHVVNLVDLSATGALVATSSPVPLDSEWALLLEANGQRLPLKARVVRVTKQSGSPDSPDACVWLAGVTFVGLSAAMAQAVVRLVALNPVAADEPAAGEDDRAARRSFSGR